MNLAQRLTEQGIAFFRFDHRGCGKSEGDFAEVTSLEGRAADSPLAAIKALVTRKGAGPFLGLFGSSMGGAACLYVASKLEVPAVVTVAAPVRSRQIRASSANKPPTRGRPP